MYHENIRNTYDFNKLKSDVSKPQKCHSTSLAFNFVLNTVYYIK